MRKNRQFSWLQGSEICVKLRVIIDTDGKISAKVRAPKRLRRR
jgi:hypothetical protein